MAMKEEKTRGMGRFTRWGIGANLALMIVLALAGLILVNLIARLPGIWTRVDLTAHRQNELSPQTEKILQSLQGEVQVISFLKGGGRYAELLQTIDVSLWRLMKQYRYASDGKVVHENYKLDFDYATARSKLQELDIKEEDNFVVVRAPWNKQKPRVLRTLGDIATIRWPKRMPTGEEQPPAIDQFRAEEAINGAILAVTDEKKPRIGFLEGHGEPSIGDQNGRQGLYQFAEDLRKVGYDALGVNLAASPKALEGLAALVVAGPISSVDAGEAKLLREYFDAGGRLLLLLNSGSQAFEGSELSVLMQEWGIRARPGLVREPWGGQVGLPECSRIQVLDGLSDLHKITREIRRLGLRVAFQDSRGLEIAKEIGEGFTIMELASTGLWAWEDQLNGRPWFQDPGLEPSGRRVLAYALDREPAAEGAGSRKRFRSVVVGTHLLASNYFFLDSSQSGAGADFLRNAIAWLVERENLISIAPKPAEQRYFRWTPQRESLFFWLCLFLLPGACLGAGLVVWWRRRR